MLSVIARDGDGDVEELVVENADYNPQSATDATSDAANTALLAGNTYADISDQNVALFTFSDDGGFAEVFQRIRDGATEVGELGGEWSIDGEGVVRVAYGREDQSGARNRRQAAQVTAGLGSAEMSIETIDENNDSSRAVNLIQVEAFAEGEMLGSWFELGADGLATTSLTFEDDGSGAYEDQYGGGRFDWRLEDDGRLRVFSKSAGSDSLETVTCHKLANSEGEMLSVVMVFRLNGELDYDRDVGPHHPPRNALDTYMLFRAF
ncbi:MAG: hypothetical protein AAF184_19120 [Pseudomonadota bacterium]